MKMRLLFLTILPLFLLGCFTELREGGLRKADFAEITLQGCTYRLYSTSGVFEPGKKIDFEFSINNQTDSAKQYNLSDNRFLYVFLKNPDNKIFYKETIPADRFFREKLLILNPNSIQTYKFSLLPQKSFTDTINAIYCQSQLTLLPKGMDYNRLSFFIRRK